MRVFTVLVLLKIQLYSHRSHHGRMRKSNPIGQVTKTVSQVKCETRTTDVQLE